MTQWPPDVRLSGDHVTLEPLSMIHAEDLAEASEDGKLYELWYTSVPSPDRIPDDIASKLDQKAAGTMLPFAALSPAGKPVGVTTFMNVDAANRRLEIGHTWYRKAVQRTALNTECKFLLLRHAFETLDCIAVEFRTHFANRQSRAAIERLGAKLDGILRSHKIMADGSLRDTAVYSILAAEWPMVRSNLMSRLR